MEIVSFEIAKKLNEKGFTLPKSNVIGKFDSDGVFHSQLYINFTETMDSEEIIAPTISQVLKWLREKYKVFILIEPDLKAPSYELVFSVRVKFFIKDEEDEGFREKYLTYRRKSHEQAAIAGICWTLDNLIGVWDLLL